MNECVYHVMAAEKHLGVRQLGGGDQTCSREHSYSITLQGYSKNLCVFSHSVMSDSLQPPGLVARQAPLPMGFSRREYWSGFPSPGGLPDPGIGLGPPALQADSLPAELPRKPLFHHYLPVQSFVQVYSVGKVEITCPTARRKMGKQIEGIFRF